VLSPFLVDDFALSHAEVGLLFGLYMLPGVVLALPGGVVGQRFGAGRVAIGGAALMVAGGLVTASSDSFVLACLGRVVSGSGAVPLSITLAKMVAEWFAGREISLAMSVMLAAWPLGIGLAVAMLGTFASAYSWRAAVHATVLACAVGLVLIATVYRDPARAAAGGSVIARPFARLSPRTVAMAVGAGLVWTFFNTSFIVLVSSMPAVLVAYGATIGRAGALVSLALWVTLVSVPLAGWVADRIRQPSWMIAGGSVVTALLIFCIPILPHPTAWFALGAVTAGAPAGAIMALLPQSLPGAQVATAFGIYYTVYFLGMAGVQPVAGLIRDASGSPAAQVLFAGVLMLLTAAAFAAYRWIEQRGRR
jgi:MFS family permease